MAGTIATAAAELCWKVAHTVGLTAKLDAAADFSISLDLSLDPGTAFSSCI